MIVLIVDDEEGVRRSLRKVLERERYGILAAENGREAIEIVKDNKADIAMVISDYKMPGLNGLETLIEIGRLNPEITRIILTGYATMESAIESVNAGIDGFLTKPFDNAELRAKVKEYNIKKRLKQFVSEPVLNELQRDAADIDPKRQRISVMFTDIRGFTGLVEDMNPMDLSELINRHYFAPLDQIVYDYRGTLDKHIGDGIMGIFGAPKAAADDAARAVLAALKMREEMAAINSRLSQEGKRIGVGIGISTGEAMVGIFGSAKKKEYTAFGLPVNVASRLEHLAREGQILICEQTYEQVRDLVTVEPLGAFALKGMQRQVEVLNVMGIK
ncbi:MAG: adenylate/guanylate cyclase domain-containing protein [Pseudomonadota bacterium]|nr:adenylate/guanylate cyclase domain-containing protein [Pseudomonadota bacterium]